MITIVTRSEWGARPPKTTPRKIATPTPELWLHHSASQGEDERSVRAIQNYHMDVKKWNDIAYSFLVDNDAPDVDVFEGRGPGISGGHTLGHNTISHAICVLGNFNDDVPTDQALETIAQLVAHGYEEEWWPLGFTGGHRDTRGSNPGDCPGDNLYALIGYLNMRAVQIYEGRNMPGEYRGVVNCPTSKGQVMEFAKTVIDWAIAEGLIVEGDEIAEDWQRPLVDGRYWTFEHRRRNR